MKFRDWWKCKNGHSKLITILAALLFLQIGLCFATPVADSTAHSLFHIPQNDPYETLAYMIWEALLAVIVFFVLLMVAFSGNWFTGVIYKDTKGNMEPQAPQPGKRPPL